MADRHAVFRVDDWKWAWFHGPCYCVIEIGTTYAFFWSNQWQRQFYDAIEQRQGARFLSLVVMFLKIAGMEVGTMFATTSSTGRCRSAGAPG